MPQKGLFILACVVLLFALGVTVGYSYASEPSRDASQDQMLLAQAKQSKAAAGGKSEQAEMHNKEGLDAFTAGKYEEAIRHYNEALKIDRDNVRAYNNRGVAYTKLGNYNLAISDYTKALQLNPKLAEVYQNRALANFRARDYPQSCADLKQFRQLGGTPSPEFVKDLESASGRGQC